jgi:hypothetical protein
MWIAKASKLDEYYCGTLGSGQLHKLRDMYYLEIFDWAMPGLCLQLQMCMLLWTVQNLSFNFDVECKYMQKQWKI